MENETNEMINNAAEEIVENTVEKVNDNLPTYIRIIDSPKGIAQTIAYGAIGVAVFELAKWGVKKIWRFGEKTVGDIKDKKNAKKAAKAKIVNGTDCTVENA